MYGKNEIVPSYNQVSTSPTSNEKKPAIDGQSGGGPKDKYLIVFFIFLIHGLGTLMPWNMFITAKKYFVDFKLSGNHTLAENFMLTLTFASQIPNVLFNWLNVFVKLGFVSIYIFFFLRKIIMISRPLLILSGDTTTRIVISILVEIVIFIVTILLAMIKSDGWSDIFFWVTMISVVLLNTMNGIYQNTIYGIAARLPVEYTGAVVLGANISGFFVAVVSIISRFVFTSFRTAAIYYFLTALLVLLICIDTYFALPINRFFRYCTSKAEADSGSDGTEKREFWAAFVAAAMQLFNVFFTFFITISIFPSMHSDVKKNDPDFFISDEFFTDITCFLSFNFFAMLGSLITSWLRWPSPKFLVIPVLLRVIFLPLFIFSNVIPESSKSRTLPVLMKNDWAYWIMAIFAALSHGYLSSLGMMYSSQVVEPQHQLIAGSYAASMLITGIFVGVLFSFALKAIVSI